jgi:MFS transporter, SP family, general alpha glucoside:H+ symporter
MTDIKQEASVAHLESDQRSTASVPKIDGYESYGLVKSRFDELSLPRTLWTFKRVVLVVISVYTGYVCEGFEVRTRLVK